MRSWKIGTAFDIGVYVHPTFWILPLVTVINGLSGGAELLGMMLALLAAAMGCVVLHEFGHALMARYFGIRTRDITLYPIGGVARLERLSEKPSEELLIALAGPAVNVVIAAILFPLVLFTGLKLSFLDHEGSAIGFFIFNLFAINVGLVLFNMIPAFPMDGGRVLRAILAGPLGRLRATEIASTVGLVIAGLLVVGFLFLHGTSAFFSNPFLVLIALFIGFVGRQELKMVRYQEAMRHAPPSEQVQQVVSARPIYAEVTATPDRPGFTGFLWDGNLRAWVFWRDGQPIAAYAAGHE